MNFLRLLPHRWLLVQQVLSLKQLVDIVLSQMLLPLELSNRLILLFEHRLMLHRQSNEHHHNLDQLGLLANKSNEKKNPIIAHIVRPILSANTYHTFAWNCIIDEQCNFIIEVLIELKCKSNFPNAFCFASKHIHGEMIEDSWLLKHRSLH